MTSRALLALVNARLRSERRAVAYLCAAALVAGFVQPHGLAAPLFFCSTLGIVAALLQTPGRQAHLDLCEEGAPLFGRERARAKALVPCIMAALATVTYFAASLASGLNEAPFAVVVALAAVIAATLTALSATIRTGPSRSLYVAMAGAGSVAAYAVATYAKSIPGELALCALISFLALRQYGEALARYDPV